LTDRTRSSGGESNGALALPALGEEAHDAETGGKGVAVPTKSIDSVPCTPGMSAK
jgi:hypothetical protein